MNLFRTSASSNLSKGYYPVFLNLEGEKALVIGGGKVAERKILALIKTGADVTVISPEITKKIEQEKLKGTIKHICRNYRKGDLNKAFIVIAATDLQGINEQVSREAHNLVNVVDTPHLCNFIVPSVIKRGPLTIAISTGGISPAFSKSIRRELEKIYGPEFAGYLNSLRNIRNEAMKVIKDQRKRGEFLKSLASEKMVKTLRGKGCEEAKKIAQVCLKKAKAG